jgi:hypothetical protein
LDQPLALPSTGLASPRITPLPEGIIMPVSVRFMFGTEVIARTDALKWLTAAGIHLDQEYPEHVLESLDPFLARTTKTYGFLDQSTFVRDLVGSVGRPRATGAAPMITLNAVYCPGIDDEMKRNIASLFMHFPKMYKTAFEGGCKCLGSLSPQARLYILCHGHAEMPLFTTEKGKWTARQLADMLEGDGLRKDHRDIELLVCHAGESVSSSAAADKRMGLAASFAQAKAKGDETTMARLKAAYSKVKAPAPAPFTSGSQVLPVVAQLVQVLKDKHYDYLSITSYACPVAQYYANGQVHLDLKKLGGQWGVPASRHPELKKVWH